MMFLVLPKKYAAYNLKKPNEKFFLPYVLEEISGLGYVEDGLLACVQDEDGKVFLFDYKDKKITRSIKFWKQGDFEGVEVINNVAYVIKSNGDLYYFNLNTDDRELVAKELETPLSKSNDIEGLGYDHLKKKLLIACKESSDLKGNKIKGKATFVYDLKKQKFIKEPLFSITNKQLKEFFKEHKDNVYEEKRINFHPSGIALHPIHDKFYILASTGKLMIVVNRKGDIEASYPISPRVLGQPEGICFAPNGDLFIASEGAGDRGYILKFEMQ